jgi:uncharacterized Ntn-hydrolase superfamily protein
MTYSIVAWDPDTREWGVAVASKFLAAGAVVPWVRAGAGAVATQAHANVTYGPRGLDLLASRSADDVVHRLIETDDGREHRQVGVVDRNGQAANFTGTECFDWAGDRTGDGFACQGNILTGPGVVDDMAATFEEATGDLAGRLLAALLAGDRAGGDRRGRQSAAMLIAREGGGYLGDSDIALDLRVDDHDNPAVELGRLLDIHRLLFPHPTQLDFTTVDDELAPRLAAALTAAGFATDSTVYDDDLQRALLGWMGTENLEMRWSDAGMIDRAVLEILLDQPAG